MFEQESIRLIKENFNIFFDKMIEDIATDDDIKLAEFQHRRRIIEVMRDNLNETFDYLGFLVMVRKKEVGDE